MEMEHREQAPARGHLTIEHVMLRKLTDDWRRDLGEDAEDVHGLYCDRIANLTLSGDITNSRMGAGTFDTKRESYGESTIGITRRLADENQWNRDAIERRAEYLTRSVPERWPWQDKAGTGAASRVSDGSLRWRIGGGPWRGENAASQMVLNVAAALLSLDPGNAERLSGDAVSSNLHLATRFPPGTKAGALTMRAVPGHDDYVLYPYGNTRPQSAERCRKMGERCNVTVEVDGGEKSQAQEFWRFLMKRTGGLPGQKDTWRGANQWTDPLNVQGDRIGLFAGSERLSLYVRSNQRSASPQRAARMQKYSRMIREQMSDQTLGDTDEASASGRSVSLRRSWTRDSEDEWPAAAEWLMDQFARLRALLADPVDER